MLKTKVENGQLYAKDSEGYWRKSELFECTSCGKQFARPTHVASRMRGDPYCSPACASKSGTKFYHKQRVWHTCYYCGYRQKKTKYRAWRNKTCGATECLHKARSDANKARFAEQAVYITCTMCGDKYRVPPSNLGRKVCGKRDCVLESRQIKIKRARTFRAQENRV